jgi:ribonuclease P protein component
MNMGRHLNTFKKEERLAGFKAVAELFEDGKVKVNFPVKVVFLEKAGEDNSGCRAIFSVSKRNFKKAADRNQIKRRMREAYRLNKGLFYAKLNGKRYNLAFIYIASEILPYPEVEKSLKEILSRLAK